MDTMLIPLSISSAVLVVILSEGELFIVLRVLILVIKMLTIGAFILIKMWVHDTSLVEIVKQNLKKLVSLKTLFILYWGHYDLSVLIHHLSVSSYYLLQ